MPTLSRRTLLNSALLGAAGLSLSAWTEKTFGAARQAALTTLPLADKLTLVQGAGGNVVFATGANDVLMVDGGTAERSAELLKLIAEQTGGKPIKTLFNTHWHWDHTGSNETLAGSGASIVAHENTRLWLSTEVNSRWEDRVYPPRPKALPNKTFFNDPQRMEFDQQRVEYGHLPLAHTDGDIYVFFPTQNVIVAGDVVSADRYPVVDYSTTGWLGGMIGGLRTLLSLADDRTQIVPGSGSVCGKAAVQAQLDMCLTVLQRIGESYFKGETWEQFVASRPTREFDAKWGDPGQFLRMSYEGAWYHVNEIRRVTR